MTKKELVEKLDRIGGQIEDLQESIRQSLQRLEDAHDETTRIQSLLEEIPTEADEIEDGEKE